MKFKDYITSLSPVTAYHINEAEVTYEYNLFVETLELFEQSLDEALFEVPKKLKDTWDKIKEYSKDLNVGFKELARVFTDRVIFKTFKVLGFSFLKLFDIAKKGYKAYQKLINEIGIFLHKQGITKFTDKHIEALQEYLEQHPIAKKIGGVVLAGLLIYIWTSTIAFSGDLDFDFDQTMLFGALTSNYNLVDLLTGPDGAQFMAMVALGVSGTFSFPWPGSTPILFGASILYTLGKKHYPKVAKKLKMVIQQNKNK